MKNGNFLMSFKNALAGLAHCFKNERNFRFHILAAVLAVILAFFLKVSKEELMLIIFAIFFVIVSEIFNTAVESLCDMVSKDYNKYIKIAKDCSAAAVLMSAVNAVAVGVIVFLPKLIDMI